MYLFDVIYVYFTTGGNFFFFLLVFERRETFPHVNAFPVFSEKARSLRYTASDCFIGCGNIAYVNKVITISSKEKP